ncbi:MAG: hypothetical protein K0R14_1733 [Burkholderiales bacterium]|jgi:hypothetical protein|nr:hypothetical protein [Burkholderiales bacterium]
MPYSGDRIMQKIINKIIALGFILSVAACATKMDPTQKAPGFLPNYALLKPISTSPDGTQIYTYKAPDAKRSDYHAAIVEPAALYQSATESGVKAQEIEQARKNLNDGIVKVVSKKIAITDKPGKGVARVYTAITGAVLEPDSLKPWNLIPISAAITLASKVTNLDNKKPILVVELKIVDSQSGKLLREVATIINGEKFRLSSNTADEFQKLAVQWVDQAIQYSSSH